MNEAIPQFDRYQPSGKCQGPGYGCESVRLGEMLAHKYGKKNQLSAYVDAHWQEADGHGKSLLQVDYGLAQSICDNGSKGGPSNKVQVYETRQLVVDTFRMIDSPEQTKNLDPLLTLASKASR